MEIKTLVNAECKRTRQLWEEVFWEDSKRFTDYYFEQKAPDNIAYVIGEEPFDAMMFRTSYDVQIGEEQRRLSYLVGVGTREACRHRGYMRSLLLYSFRKMYEEKLPFTFLMPADPAIYEPFDFRYIYEKEVWKPVGKIPETTEGNIRGEGPDDGLYSVSKLREKKPLLPLMNLLAEFANTILSKRCRIYVHRDEAYYERQWKELKAQNGDIYVLWEQGRIVAFYLYAKEGGEVFIQEVLEEEEGKLKGLKKNGEKKPSIMARILHLEEMLKLVRTKEEKRVVIRIKDPLIAENEGVYDWEITPKESRVTRLDPSTKAELCMSVSELAPAILTEVFLNEIV